MINVYGERRMCGLLRRASDGSVLDKGMGWSSKAIGKREFRRHVELEPVAQAGG